MYQVFFHEHSPPQAGTLQLSRYYYQTAFSYKALIVLSEKKSSIFTFGLLCEYPQLSYLRILERRCSNIAGDYVYEEIPQEP